MEWDLNPIELDLLIERALQEDIGGGDVTTLATISARTEISGILLAKDSGLICGMPVFRRVFQRLDPAVVVEEVIGDGRKAEPGDVLARLSGPARAILTGERTALNFLQRLSAIATKTAWAVAQVQGTRARITDTRKTTPGLRMLEKYAVRTGGGCNHRFNLSDGILIKDNHIRAAGGISQAISLARAHTPHTLRIEVEVENRRQIDQALQAGADIIMLDNMGLDDIEEAVRLISGKAIVEISGNMGQRDLARLAATGVDLISIGALTHTVQAMDISLRFN